MERSTSGSNILCGSAFFNVDAGLVRNFKIKERFDLQFRTKAYGLTNTSQFSKPATNVSNATFLTGVVSGLNGYNTIRPATGAAASPVRAEVFVLTQLFAGKIGILILDTRAPTCRENVLVQ